MRRAGCESGHGSRQPGRCMFRLCVQSDAPGAGRGSCPANVALHASPALVCAPPAAATAAAAAGGRCVCPNRSWRRTPRSAAASSSGTWRCSRRSCTSLSPLRSCCARRPAARPSSWRAKVGQGRGGRGRGGTGRRKGLRGTVGKGPRLGGGQVGGMLGGAGRDMVHGTAHPRICPRSLGWAHRMHGTSGLRTLHCGRGQVPWRPELQGSALWRATMWKTGTAYALESSSSVIRVMHLPLASRASSECCTSLTGVT